jgi:hypothetical protein
VVAGEVHETQRHPGREACDEKNQESSDLPGDRVEWRAPSCRSHAPKHAETDHEDDDQDQLGEN